MNGAGMRAEFAIPTRDGTPIAYFCGNSLGLQPNRARLAVTEALDSWATRAVDGHFDGPWPWMPYHEFVREGLAAVVGAKPHEVVAMNGLTTNLHLMMASFYRPSPKRHAILIEAGAFPSDRHAVASQIRWHGYDPDTSLIEFGADQDLVDEQQLCDWLDQHGEQVALVLWPGVQYRTGQAFDLARIAAAARARECPIGFDLAHAAGNLPLDLHGSDADFAVWCSYKYLNSGPGSIAGCFVHERHADFHGPRLEGWWGHRADSRFRMQAGFVPSHGADAWQLSNPPILALAPLRGSLEVFAQAGGMQPLREQSLALSGALLARLEADFHQQIECITPRDPAARGCQLSLRVRGGRAEGQDLHASLNAAGVISDWREPDVIRVAPAPLYNNDADIQRLLAVLEGCIGA